MAQAHQPDGCRFSFLPAEINDRDGRRIIVKPQERGDFFGLMRMYDCFEPKGLAQGLPPVDRHQAARWIKHLERDCFNLIALHQGLVVGHAILTDLGRERSAELAIFVHQAYRQRGLGTELAQWALKCAATAHCKLLWALVQRANRPALQICRKAGFNLVQDLLEPDLELRLPLERQPSNSPLRPVDLKVRPDYKPH
jgi:GNAT superfamily N-acetyltransferase